MRRSATPWAARGLLILALLAGLGAGTGWCGVAHAGGPWYVSPTGDDAHDCLSPTTACKTIGGATGKAASGDTINIAPGTYSEDIAIFGKSLSFIGAGAASTIIDGGGVGTNATLNVTKMTIRNGSSGVYVDTSGVVTLTGVVISGHGRGIYNDGMLTVTNSTISGNHAVNSFGGGLWNRPGARATLANVTISGNTAKLSGGGILNTGTLTLTRVIISTNAVTGTDEFGGAGEGGGIYNDGTLILTDGILTDNTAVNGGGGIANVRQATLTNVTISGNTVGTVGAGVDNYFTDFEGPMALNLTNVTISDNTSGNVAGGLNNSGGNTAALTNVTISGNAAKQGGAIHSDGTTRLKNTVIAKSVSGGNCFVENQPLVSLGHNLDSGATCGLTGVGDLKNVDPKLGPLQNNGGFSSTHALLGGSPAIDKGDNAGCPTTDQRGAPRPVDGDGNGSKICDIGAYERGAGFAVYLPFVRK